MRDQELDRLMEIAWGLEDPHREMLVRELKQTRILKKLDKKINPSMYVNLLEQYYDALVANDGEPTSIKLPHSSVHYVAAVIKEDEEFIEKLGYVPSLAEVERAMYLEGMLPWNEYDVPNWFARKHAFRKDKK
tara:strand:+ start:296 stop:694 length:399 start_codon:yes stop_codon:yes gene_type:complete